MLETLDHTIRIGSTPTFLFLFFIYFFIFLFLIYIYYFEENIPAFHGRVHAMNILTRGRQQICKQMKA